MWRMVRLQGRISNVGELHGGSCWTSLWFFRRQQLVALNQCKFIRAEPFLLKVKIVLFLLITKKCFETCNPSKFEGGLPSPVVYSLGWSICHPSNHIVSFLGVSSSYELEILNFSGYEVTPSNIPLTFSIFEVIFDYLNTTCMMQVVIIYEPTVGSLLSKGLNRMIGTISAIILSLICAEIAEASGAGEVYVIGVSLFLGGLAIGFIRQVQFEPMSCGNIVLGVKEWPANFCCNACNAIFRVVIMTQIWGLKKCWGRDAE